MHAFSYLHAFNALVDTCIVCGLRMACRQMAKALGFFMLVHSPAAVRLNGSSVNCMRTPLICIRNGRW